jgi:hypothetical protein
MVSSQLYLTVACPRCLAPAGQGCRKATPAGVVRAGRTHTERAAAASAPR